MKRTGWLFHAFLTGFILVGGMVAQETSRPLESPPNTQRPVGSEQETLEEKQPPQQPEPSQPEPQIQIPVLGAPNEFALVTDLEYYEPEPGFDRQDRDIDLQVARAALAVHFRQGWEFQFDVLAIRARGAAILSSTPPIPPPVSSNALALGVGPLLRWNFLQFSRLRLFVDGQADFILADRPFPTHGTINDFFLRAGGGLSFRVNDSYWVESAFRFAHISNGECFCSGNPAWQGRGLSIGIRRTFGRPAEARGKTSLPVSEQAKEKEKAWITSAEDYWSAPGTNLQNPKIQHEVRALRISRTWPFPKGLELQLGGMVANAKGGTQTGQIGGFGPLLRWNFLQTGRFRLFADGGADFFQMGAVAYVLPGLSNGYNFLLRAGSGASVRLHSAYWLDASFRYAHITTGFGSGESNYVPWSGLGASVALRHTFH